jgi:hypothetical protein
MSGKKTNDTAETAQAVAAAANSPAAQKLAEALKDLGVSSNVLDHIVGPKRVVDLSTAPRSADRAKARAKLLYSRRDCSWQNRDAENETEVEYQRHSGPSSFIGRNFRSPSGPIYKFDQFGGIGDLKCRGLPGACWLAR